MFPELCSQQAASQILKCLRYEVVFIVRFHVDLSDIKEVMIERNGLIRLKSFNMECMKSARLLS